MLTKVLVLATETVPACDLASITVLKDGTPQTPVFTDKTALRLDETQYEAGDGPCLSAIRHRGLEHIDVTTERRWPEFAEAARRAGVRATLSVPLGNEEAVLGGLNLYSRSTSTFDEGSLAAACAFADQLGLAAANATVFAESYCWPSSSSRRWSRAL